MSDKLTDRLEEENFEIGSLYLSFIQDIVDLKCMYELNKRAIEWKPPWEEDENET